MISVKTFLVFLLETISCAGERKPEKLRGWRRELGMEGRGFARSREVGTGAMVLHHVSVPHRVWKSGKSCCRRRQRSFSPIPPSLNRHFLDIALEEKSSVLRRAGAGEKLLSHPTDSIMACSHFSLQLCVVGPPLDKMGGWDMAPIINSW